MANILAKEMIGLSFPPTMESKCMMRMKEFRMFSKNESVKARNEACIYGAFVSVDTNDILTNDEFLILDVGGKIISEDNGRI
ncbi:hypothetical protein Tco_0589814 [Tanacetum coccineum]